MRGHRRRKSQTSAWLIAAFAMSFWLFVGYPALAAWNPPPGGTPPSGNLPGPIWDMTGLGIAQDASIAISNGGAFGGYLPDPVYKVTSPSAYFGDPSLGNTYIDGDGVKTDSLTLTAGAAAGAVMVSDADGKAAWQSIAIDECGGTSGKYDHASVSSYTGLLSVGGKTGYEAANAACTAGYHICTPDELLRTVRCAPTSLPASGNYWLANGAPSFTSPAANDCAGWTSQDSAAYGSFWQFTGSNGGKGFSTSCNLSLKIACCGD